MALTLPYEFNHPAPVKAIHAVIYATLETLPAWPPEYHIQYSTRHHESLAGGLQIRLVAKDATDRLQYRLVIALEPVLGGSYIRMHISPNRSGGTWGTPTPEAPLLRLFRELAERLKAEIDQLEFPQGEQALKGVPQQLAKQDSHGLAPRYNRVAHLMATGKNDAEIAAQLEIKESAAYRYRKEIAAHFNVSITPAILRIKLVELGYGAAGDENIP